MDEGQSFFMWLDISLRIAAFFFKRSSRDMPGLRASPAVITTMLAPLISSKFSVPVILDFEPNIGRASEMSKALPFARPGTISSKTTSASPASATLDAIIAPTFPAPITAIFMTTSS